MKLTTEDTENTERATPETDAKVSGHIGFYSCATVPAELSRKLERERDEAREAFVIATDQMVIAHGKLREANKERDEARAEREILRLDAQREAEHHDRMITELEGLYDQNAKLRDLCRELRQLKEGEK
jgi:hypothetical protein